MAYVSEIEKLERRWAENPLGLTFAPLAEAYRKGGDTQRALDLLRTGLDVHPDYIPANIVLGRCHMDLGDDAAAEAAFERVLALDQENVIALKALADVAESAARPAAAARWLERLLSVDRSNEDAREQLQRVAALLPAPEAAPPAEPVTPVSVVVEPVAPEAEPAVPSIEVAAESSVEVFGAALPELEEGAGIVGVQDDLPEGATGFEPEPLPVAVPNPLHEPALVEPPTAAVAVAMPSGLLDLDVEAPAPSFDAGLDVESAAAEQSEEFAPVEAAAAEPPVAEAAPAEPVLADIPLEPVVVTEGDALEEPVVADGEDWSAPVPVLTETMAELYVSQGHLGPALAVYRHLAEQHAAEPRFAARIAELEAAVAAPAPPAEPPAPAYAASQGGGMSVREFFAALAAGQAPSWSAGAAAPVMAAAPATADVEPPPAGELTFEEFFRPDSPGAGPAGGGADREDAAPEASEFQAWLRTLRS